MKSNGLTLCELLSQGYDYTLFALPSKHCCQEFSANFPRDGQGRSLIYTGTSCYCADFLFTCSNQRWLHFGRCCLPTLNSGSGMRVCCGHRVRIWAKAIIVSAWLTRSRPIWMLCKVTKNLVVWKMGHLLSSLHGRSKRIKSGKLFLLGKHSFWTYSKKDIYYMNSAHVSTASSNNWQLEWMFGFYD